MSDIVTESSDESVEPKSAASDPSATNHDELTSPDQLPGHPISALASEDEGLPEWEPLTPELVEDEAIRGDFVIRWVVVGLALLLGISQISETRTLLHLKNGEYLLGHGLLPVANDVFSYTANDRKWVNLSWLFDIAAAGLFSVSGGIGLSIVQGLLAGLTFGLLVHAVRPDIRTWWGSLCAVLALLVCYSQFTVQPELITLLGLSFVLWTLIQSDEPGQSGRLWLLVPALLIWAQFDQRAWFGWFLMLLWATGDVLSRKHSPLREKGPLGTVAILSLAVVAIHPFLWESWWAPVRMYFTDYPAMRFAYPQPSSADLVFHEIWKPFFWRSINHRGIAALILATATVVTMVLNGSRLRWSHLCAFFGFNALSLLATHELAAASLINCVLSTVNAQEWYRDRFGQVYSIDWRELLFSRGGRAVTVISFFALAWLILSGRLDGPGGKRTGLGFDGQLANAMNGYQKQNFHLVDDQPFNFSLRQGDLMIWGGLKPFIDSRAGLYFGNETTNLLDLHHQTRQSLRQKQEAAEGSNERVLWKETFNKYHIHQAWPRLTGPFQAPDYATFFSLLSSREFELSDLNSATAIFLRKDVKNETVDSNLKQYPFDLIARGFRIKPDQIEEVTREWSKPATTYDNLFALRRPNDPAGVQIGQHYVNLMGVGRGSQTAASALLAIRHANQGLRSDANTADGYRVLGMSYTILGQLEAAILSQQGVQSSPNFLRYYQAVAALQQANALKPGDNGTIQLLMQQYRSMKKLDLQLDLMKKLKQLRPYSKTMTDDQRQERDGIVNAIDQLYEPVAEVQTLVDKALSEGKDRFQVAAGAYQMGCVLIAVKTLEEDAIFLEKNPQAKLVLGGWLMEVGRGREAETIFESLEGFAVERSLTGWRDSAAISALTVANYSRAIKLWGDQRDTAAASPIIQTMFTLPFLTLNPLWMGPDAYPTSNLGATAQVIQGVRQEGALATYQIALAQMEAGTVDEASRSIRRAIELYPGSPLRPLLRFYLECLTGEQIELKPEDSKEEELFDLMEREPEPDGKQEQKAKPAQESKTE
jgi:tetratricopeptide (TPR) repeat protein